MASRRDATGSIVGLAVFLAGVGLLAITFKFAFDMFGVSQAKALGLTKGQAIDLGATGGSFADIVIRLGVLLIMAIVGSLVANKGIGLYAGSLHPVEKHLIPGANAEIPLQEVDPAEQPQRKGNVL